MTPTIFSATSIVNEKLSSYSPTKPTEGPSKRIHSVYEVDIFGDGLLDTALPFHAGQATIHHNDALISFHDAMMHSVVTVSNNPFFIGAQKPQR